VDVVFLFIGLWLMLQAREFLKALKEKAEADRRLREAQFNLLKAMERKLHGETHEAIFPDRLRGLGRN
jgi:hypothetical protein